MKIRTFTAYLLLDGKEVTMSIYAHSLTDAIIIASQATAIVPQRLTLVSVNP